MPVTHQAAPGNPAEANALDPGSCVTYVDRARATTSPCAGSHSRTAPSSVDPSTTASYHLHTTTTGVFRPAATATKWPGATRSTRGDGNVAENRTETAFPSAQTRQASSSTSRTRYTRRCGADITILETTAIRDLPLDLAPTLKLVDTGRPRWTIRETNKHTGRRLRSAAPAGDGDRVRCSRSRRRSDVRRRSASWRPPVRSSPRSGPLPEGDRHVAYSRDHRYRIGSLRA